MYLYGQLAPLYTDISATVLRCWVLKLNHQKDLVEERRKMHLTQNSRKCHLTPSCTGPFNCNTQLRIVYIQSVPVMSAAKF